MNKINKIILTGGTGFIGSHIVKEFLKHKILITCLVRENSNVNQFEGLRISLVYGDIGDEESLIRGFKGFDCVIHNAAYVRDWGEYDIFYNTNVLGTLNVFHACKKNDIKHIIMTGSNAVYGEENSVFVKDEQFPYNSHYNYFLDAVIPCKLNYYRDTKALATKEAAVYAEKNNMDLTILEPVWVFGEREVNTGFYEYIKSAKKGMIFAPGSKKNTFHVIYAEDLARAFYLAYEKNLKGIHRIIIGNREPEKMDTIYSLFCKEANVRKPVILPKFIMYPIALMLELLCTIFNSKNPPLLTRGRVNMFYDNIHYSVEKAKNLLSFTNIYTLEEGIRKTVSWYKQNKLI